MFISTSSEDALEIHSSAHLYFFPILYFLMAHKFLAKQSMQCAHINSLLYDSWETKGLTSEQVCCVGRHFGVLGRKRKKNGLIAPTLRQLPGGLDQSGCRDYCHQYSNKNSQLASFTIALERSDRSNAPPLDNNFRTFTHAHKKNPNNSDRMQKLDFPCTTI